MSIEIKTTSVEPIRQTYSHIARRFGEKPATRYQEASYDLEAKTNFHYRPQWDANYELNDERRTAIRMEDWYAVSDPRQFYYGAYVGNRAKMQEQAETSYGFCDKRNLLTRLPEETQKLLLRLMVPLRHVELGANMNNSKIAGEATATTVSQMHIYQAMDRLGIGQYLSRIALMIDGSTGTALDESKGYWMDDELWQPMRKLVEDSLVVQDWFELTLLQNILMDGLMFPLVYHKMDEWLESQGAEDVSMLTEFMRDWYKDTLRWTNAMMKAVAGESDANVAQLQQWVDHWEPQVYSALKPLAEASVGVEALDEARAELSTRLKKVGLQSRGVSA
ncbi:aromatic/alkene monooxygenase hydroxylase subunit beta [Marinobacter shengliensis]|jgi:phenol hydroxylase P1 protein|uniref:aromatic/alkene monooxygenase hydroxylase subunit beta n=1 Tax=Marinobacter shengliensis TaxID=1389223 RepID=UPI000D0FD853|nr:aromatic/alkene monooxygenase hydroxylase subunit beta [Marinobacter shengliensis]PSF13871.1 phenol hydroxylase [Marinobacter shengliensis]